MYREDELIPISALQHFIFCSRQCALIHIEGLWSENRLTVEGRLAHQKVHGEARGPRGSGRTETRGNIRIVRGLSLCSYRWGLIGKAEAVEFHHSHDGVPPPPPLPVEHKRGRPKQHDADTVQVCAQALCLEEMLDLPEGSISTACLFYGRTRRRLEVPLDASLRARTLAVLAQTRQMLNSGQTPRVRFERKCRRCSLLNLCLPNATGPGRSASRYLSQHFAASESCS